MLDPASCNNGVLTVRKFEPEQDDNLRRVSRFWVSVSFDDIARKIWAMHLPRHGIKVNSKLVSCI